MKRLFVAALCALGFASAYAEPLDHWEITGGTMTDREWTFGLSLRSDIVPGTEDIHKLYVMECTGYPEGLSTLDFSKPLVNTSGSTKYAITDFAPYGSFLSDDAKSKIEHLRLPTHGYEFSLSAGFKNCVNLVSVEPFLPDGCTKIVRGAFQGCTKLSSPLVWKNGSGMAKPSDSNWGATYTSVWELFEGTAIPSVDLSESSLEVVSRATFNNCTALKSAKLPSTLALLDGGTQPFQGCTSLELVEFNSVPTNSLSAFSGCTSLKEVRFCHCAPKATIPAGIYNQLNQNITTYLFLDDAETDNIAAWAALTAGGELADLSTWSQTYAGSSALMAKRPLLRYAVTHISLEAGQDGAVIAGRPGTFVVSRADGDPFGGSVMVSYTITGGTAEEGVHFEPLSGIVAIPSGEKSGILEVTPKYFAYVGTETLTLKLAEGDYEIVEGEDEATISLSTESLRSVSITKGEDADEGTGKVGYFVLSRGEGESTDGPVEVLLSFGGSAVNGQTYRPIGPSVTIPACEKTLKVKVVPYDDPSVAEDSTVEVTILPGGYGIGTDSADPVVIKNGETYGGWKFIDTNHISDGNWTFTVSRRPADKFDDGVYHLWVQGCTAYPSAPMALDFGKAFHNFYDGTYYMIRQLEMNFGGNAAAAAGVGLVVLPDDPGYKYRILSGCFKGCPNLTSVTPFLPKTCDTVGQNAFGSLPNLVQNDLYFYGFDFGAAEGCWGIMPNCTSITNVDLSASTITALRRDCFNGCTSLKTITLPPTIQEFGAPHSSDTGMNNRSPFNGCSNVKLIFNGSILPTILQTGGYAGGESAVSAIEFSPALTTLSDAAFVPYKNLAEIKFQGVPPTEIGENIFNGFTTESVTVNVPAEYISQWREIADDKVLTKKDGGTWTSGTKQLINVYGEVKVKTGLVIIVR